MQLTSTGLSGIIGPRHSASMDIVRSICDTLEIPQIVTKWDPSPAVPRNYQINLHPAAQFISQALADVVRALGWRSYALLYEGDDALRRLRDLLQSRERGQPPLALRQLSPDGDHRPLLKEVKKSSETRVVLDCEPDLILDVLRQADEVKLMHVYQSFFITSLDAHTVDYTQFLKSGINITTLRLIQPERESVIKKMQDFTYGKYYNRELLKPERIRVETALAYDAVHVYANALFKRETAVPVADESLFCNDSLVWDHGISVRDFMLKMEHEGLTGNIMFDSMGTRVGFTLEAVELSAAGFKRIGTWTPENGFSSARTEKETIDDTLHKIYGRHLIVASRLGPPYLREKPKKVPPRIGNDRYEGYSMDLITQISEILNFTFEFQLVSDGEYGTYNPRTQRWNGLIGELISRRADLAICDLTITYERESVVDFTMPFMNLGISILYTKSERPQRNMFSFLEPFTIDVWIYMATAFLGVSVMLFLLARATPSEWKSSHPCSAESEELENTLTMSNSIWHNCGSIMQQGSDIAPQAISTRMVAGIWWFFTLIMISSYTANLAAFLTVTRMDFPINTVQDLAKQSKIKYGTFERGSTAAFFRTSNDSLYQRMWTVMKQARPDVFTNDNMEGVDRVKKQKGDYAFFMESTTIEYQTALDCDLRKVGGLLDSKGYGIALPRNSPFRTAVSGAVLMLQERGNLSALKAHWWKAEGPGCDNTDEDGVQKSSDELVLLNVGGVFLVLLAGTLAAFLIAMLEFLWNCRRIAVDEQMTPWEALVSELRFVVQCSNNSKPVRPRRVDSTSGTGSYDDSYLRQ
ncbi:glutamate receptor ionotropic, kainate 2-like [Schistocerca gregaria]|uniref:glutamate receptor ionotropic, kainate 2-like n=1 Tax=Schistocerca gregaria TaxID=7010 RepID=UPI00211DED0C|nr:glutamate receptor ionotropic, kainate 2-like [Schistocerca gregaria]